MSSPVRWRSPGTHGLDGRFDDGSKVGGPDFKRELAGDDARHVEQVFDQLYLRAGVALDGFEGAHGGRMIHVAPLQQVGPTEYGRERRPQLVRERGDMD